MTSDCCNGHSCYCWLSRMRLMMRKKVHCSVSLIQLKRLKRKNKMKEEKRIEKMMVNKTLSSLKTVSRQEGQFPEAAETQTKVDPETKRYKIVVFDRPEVEHVSSKPLKNPERKKRWRRCNQNPHELKVPLPFLSLSHP